MKTFILWTTSWIISALLLIPCLILSAINKFKVDYHFEFHKWWHNKHLKNLCILICCIALFSSCAESQPHIQECLTGDTYGFFGGLWHGMIAPIACLLSLIDNDIAVWAINNNGEGYTIGFFCGLWLFRVMISDN